jgi:hypothetical protein
MTVKQGVAVLLLLVGLCAGITRVRAQSEKTTFAQSQLSVTLRPTLGSDGKVAAIDVALDLSGIRPKAGQPFSLRIPVEFAGVKHVADRIENLEARSHEGLVNLSQVDEPPDAGGSLFWRRWKMTPAPVQLNVRYRARLDPPRPWPGPPFDLRSNGGGVSGAGFGFLVLPDSKDKFEIAVKWDLRDLPAGARGVSSLGDGDVHFEGTVDRLQECFYMAGLLGTYPANFSASHFRSAWLGTPPFDPGTEMEWSEKAYSALRHTFADTSTSPFYFFMRAGKDNESYGGAALANSFLLFAPETAPVGDDSPRLIIAHEITHHFAEGLSSPEGIEGSWFSEGLAEYYSRLAAFRARLISPDAFGKAVNKAAQAYYTNPLRNLPNQKIAEAFWRDKNVQGLPYQRGYFYFVDTNQELLAASKGKVSLDTIILSLQAQRRSGAELTPQTWKQAIEKELGASGGQEFESVIFQGEVVVPASDAFGACFERQTLPMATFELGFDQHKTLDAQPRTIQGLVPGSAADKAGLQEGDSVLAVDPVNLDQVRSDVTKRIHLRIRRGDKTLEIDYLPRGRPIEGYQWVRRASVPDDACVSGLETR